MIKINQRIIIKSGRNQNNKLLKLLIIIIKIVNEIKLD